MARSPADGLPHWFRLPWVSSRPGHNGVSVATACAAGWPNRTCSIWLNATRPDCGMAFSPYDRPMMRSPVLLASCAVFALAVGRAQATRLWKWSYTGAGIAAAGTFTTSDAPDDRGFYRIVGITGTRNGAAITGLQPTGTSVPGNQPFAVDNLVSATGGQLTIHGFGYALANGAFANPFENGAEYLEYLSVPPHPNGADTELAVRFEAMIVP